MKKICIDARNIRAGMSGLCRYALHIVKGIAAIDKENQYYILRDKRYQKQIVDNPNFKDIYDALLDTGSVQNAFLGSFTVNPLEVDVFHTLNQVVPFGLKAKKIVTTVHDLMWYERPELSFDKPRMAFGANLMAKTSFAYSYKRADVIICISETTKKILQQHYPQYAHKCKVVTHHDLFFYEEGESEKDQQFHDKDLLENLPKDYILSVGNTKPYKNIERLIQAFAQVVPNFPTTKLVILGRMDRREVLQNLANRLNISDKVFFCKQQVDDNDLKLLYKKAKFLAFPSLYEGYGIPPLEAMSLGCPVLGSTIDIVKEATGGKAFYVDPESVEEMALGIQKLLAKPTLLATLSETATEYVNSLKSYNSAEETWKTYGLSLRNGLRNRNSRDDYTDKSNPKHHLVKANNT